MVCGENGLGRACGVGGAFSDGIGVYEYHSIQDSLLALFEDQPNCAWCLYPVFRHFACGKKHMSAGIDSDYAWLMTHLEFSKGIPSRGLLASKVADRLNNRIRDGALPYTLGIFGGWGTGKTTLLAMLAEKLKQHKNRKVVYFNPWKYAGFMEIVPALIYKILQYGAEGASTDRDAAAGRVILALGKKYSDSGPMP